jgi:hypothetical protein
MGRRLLILVFISCLLSLRCFCRIPDQDETLRQIVSQYGQAEVTLRATDRKAIDILSVNVSILSVKDNVVRINLSPITVEWFIRQHYDYLIVERMNPRNLASARSLTQALQWDNYPTYTQYDSIMQSFAALYPDLCRLDTIGTSVNGKLVLALKISDNPGIDEDEPKVFYSSTMHGDETGGFILMLHFADYLLKNYSSGSRVKNLVDNLEIWINPLANPDGTYRGGNIISTPTRFNANGYDLNRNFPDPLDPNTVKQKETIDMVRFMRKHKFSLSANFHSGEEVVNYPWDRWLSKLHADDSWFYSISSSYADTAHVYAGPEYMNFLDNGVTRGAVWYLVYGGRQDFITWELQGREVTIELDNQYITPAAQLANLWQNNWHSLLGYLENALYGIHGLVRNKTSHIPVPAKVFINGYDKDSSQVYSDTLTGSFVRFLLPGSWNLSFTANGYVPVIMSNVIVTSGQKTDLIVDMVPAPDFVENPNSSTSLLLFPNPATNNIYAVLPDSMTGFINVRIINQTGALISDYNIEAVRRVPVIMDVKNLAAGIYTVLFSNFNRSRLSYGRFVVIK